MIELLAVIVILAILIALLLPSINAAMRTAKNAAVGSEINTMASALAAFKAKYGIYPPSRVYLAEDGNFGAAPATPIAPGDITYQQLAIRTVQALRTMFPRATFNTAGIVWPHNGNVWYDFNGNGIFDFNNGLAVAPNAYILQGHEALVFFLGGIPYQNSPGSFAATGFGKDPANPFSNNIPNSTMYSANRAQPLFEFAPNRLALDPLQVQSFGNFWSSPGYLDSLSNPAPTGLPNAAINFYAYFVSYGNAGYDPNDVNFSRPNQPLVGEVDVNGAVPFLAYHVGFPIPPLNTTNPALSPPPNPYTSTTTAPFNGNVFLSPTYLNPQSFQIISAGIDGLYGVAGQYTPDNTAGALPLDLSTPSPYSSTDPGLRIRERDNVTNIHSGKLD
jgi:general secretion pathway protein G